MDGLIVWAVLWPGARPRVSLFGSRRRAEAELLAEPRARVACVDVCDFDPDGPLPSADVALELYVVAGYIDGTAVVCGYAEETAARDAFALAEAGRAHIERPLMIDKLEVIE